MKGDGRRLMRWLGWAAITTFGVLPLAIVSAHGQAARPDAIDEVADSMVLSLKSASAGSGSEVNNNPLAALALMGPSDAARKKQNDLLTGILAAAREVTGESFSGQQYFQLFLSANTWLQSHQANIDYYEARTKRVNKQLLKDWQSVQDKLSVKQGQLTLVLLGIIFHDRFWQGSDWNAGNPERALVRLNALPKESVAKWAEATGLKEIAFAAANSLVTVDSLFDNDVFQPELFDQALPKAKTLFNLTTSSNPPTSARSTTIPSPPDPQIDQLLTAVQSPDPAILYPAIRALGRSADPRAVTALVSILEQGDAAARSLAIPGICRGELTDPRAIKPLIKIMNERGSVTVRALRCLLTTKAQDVVGPLIAWLPPSKVAFPGAREWLWLMTKQSYQTGEDWKKWWLKNKGQFEKP